MSDVHVSNLSAENFASCVPVQPRHGSFRRGLSTVSVFTARIVHLPAGRYLVHDPFAIANRCSEQLNVDGGEMMNKVPVEEAELYNLIIGN